MDESQILHFLYVPWLSRRTLLAFGLVQTSSRRQEVPVLPVETGQGATGHFPGQRFPRPHPQRRSGRPSLLAETLNPSASDERRTPRGNWAQAVPSVNRNSLSLMSGRGATPKCQGAHSARRASPKLLGFDTAYVKGYAHYPEGGNPTEFSPGNEGALQWQKN